MYIYIYKQTLNLRTENNSQKAQSKLVSLKKNVQSVYWKTEAVLRLQKTILEESG